MIRPKAPSLPRARRADADPGDGTDPLVRITGGALRHGERTIWRGLDLEVRPGQFWAVLGPNGSGKTSLIRALLGLQRLSEGTLSILGGPPRQGAAHLGYVPQQGGATALNLVRARDLVGFGLDGHRFGPRPRRAGARRRVDELLEAVGASAYADAPLGTLSGGERQRVRIAQALATDPRVLLCDEPLLSLDLHHQRAVTELIDRRRREAATAVVFVTHEINPVLDLVDRVLYLAPEGHRAGTPDEVLTSDSLSGLYGTRIDVVRLGGRIVVVGAPDRRAEPHHPATADTTHRTDGAHP